ncbi:ROK family protein [Companilactobacillus furfuricola]|uniref:ROK family protein n=1 Tax=Companilactobacillus furfuricola TaxID=1462575 RepID=UPI000F7774B0|nr:ROK family protein [Companilactobacillus furfuricola]
MTKKYLAFDVGGTTIKYALVDSELNITEPGKVNTEHNKDGHILKQLIEISHQFQQKNLLSGIGVSTAGIVGDDGAILYAGPTIPDYQGTKIKQELEEATTLPVFVVNDVDAALLGEAVDGTAKEMDNAYCIALGTGIGGANLQNGHLISGEHNFANSIGYILYEKESDTYYEQRASTLALEADLKQYHVGVIEAFALAKSGDEFYKKILDRWAYEVARGLAEIVLLFDPEVIVIGGAVSQQGDFLTDLLMDQLRQLVPAGLLKSELKTAELADQAQLLGALSEFLV